MKHIATPVKIGGKTAANRLVMPPMVIFGQCSTDGMPSDALIAHYAARKSLGMVIVEAACIDPAGRLHPNQLGVWSDDHVPGLARIAAAIHGNGSLAILQIHHAGAKTAAETCAQPKHAGNMTADGIVLLKRAFVDAAKRALRAGFDGVELHGAHAYLLSQFASPTHNQRTDAYGQDRTLLSVEITREVLASLPSGFIVQYRMGINEPDLAGGLALAQALERAGIHALHVSSGCGPEPLTAPDGFSHSWFVYGASQVKAAVSVPVIAVNGIKTPDEAEDIVATRLADMAAIGRQLLVDPLWAEKALGGGDVILCARCKPCGWFRSSGKCPKNPSKG